MQIVKNIRISLTMDSITQNLQQLSKEQIVEKFRILLDRKQIQINEKLEKNNAEHLLILQKKILILERKDDQIVKLNSSITALRNEVHDQNIKINDLLDEISQFKAKALHFEKKYNEFDSIYKDQKAKKEKIKRDFDKLQVDIKNVSDQLELERRNHKKLKQEKSSWQEQTEYLLKNMKNTNQEILQKQKNIMAMAYQERINSLTASLEQSLRKNKLIQQKLLQSRMNISNSNKVIQVLNKALGTEKAKNNRNPVRNTEVQTEDNHENQTSFSQSSIQKSQMMFGLKKGISVKKTQTKQQEVQAEIPIDCKDCVWLGSQLKKAQKQIKQARYSKQIKLSDEIKKSKNEKTKEFNNSCTQTQIQPTIQLLDGFSQTIFKSMDREDEIQLIKAFESIKNSTSQLLNIWKNKYAQIEDLYISRPSKSQDLEKITNLQKRTMVQEIQIIKLQKYIDDLSYVNGQLHQNIVQKNFFLNQKKAEPLEINEGNNILNSRNYLNGSRNQKITNRNTSATISFRSHQKSLSPGQKSKMMSGTQSYLTLMTEDLIIERKEGQKSAENFELRKMLEQRGVGLKKEINSSKKIESDRISQFRKYKKYKPSIRKTNV